MKDTKDIESHGENTLLRNQDFFQLNEELGLSSDDYLKWSRQLETGGM